MPAHRTGTFKRNQSSITMQLTFLETGVQVSNAMMPLPPWDIAERCFGSCRLTCRSFQRFESAGT